ncbi:MAG: CRISPR-associated endoribonuclease Cas2 [Thermotoga sp. 50_1627]|nr:MAG: CRISPR-associated endoribonuclease Cas2 [Thermotoga sp. 50_64]KUK25286.1 MAG: CRISPR-associated endoribonuclease Cas2 [Thermotoga sp. 50_1627]
MNEKRVAKVHKILSRYLFWQQNSTFEGYLPKGSVKELLRKVRRLLAGEDALVIYFLTSQKRFTREVLGVDKSRTVGKIVI